MLSRFARCPSSAAATILPRHIVNRGGGIGGMVINGPSSSSSSASSRKLSASSSSASVTGFNPLRVSSSTFWTSDNRWALVHPKRHCSSKQSAASSTTVEPDEVSSGNITNNSSSTTTSSSSSSGTETVKGDPATHEFQAETRKLLDIVAKSLYSEKEVFIRELVSNASDAIERMRYLLLTGEQLGNPGRSLEIKIDTDKLAGTITITDSGVGMNKEEMIDNLGTIARSGSRAFIQEMEAKQQEKVDPKDIIGQFGVGFYSAFMVADRIEVFSKSSRGNSQAFHWESDGSGTYKIQEADGVQEGTKIIVHLKSNCTEFADETNVRDIIKKYSSFVGSDIKLNNTKANDLRPVWLMDPKEVSQELHEDFYRYIGNSFDKPRFIYHFRADAPMDIRALFYVPESRPGLFETSRESGDVGVSLYCRKILIKSKAENVVPKWMRFVKGVVDSEDIPLNLSRELLQDSAQIRKLRTVITNKFLRFMQERARKDAKSYIDFYKDYAFFFKEGIITSNEQYEKEELARLLRFESSAKPAGELVSLPEYKDRMQAGQRDVFYLAAPSRQLAETSPYFEALRKKDVEILFCYESYDELVLMQLQQFDKLKLTSVEKEMRQGDPGGDQGQQQQDTEEEKNLLQWMQTQLGPKASKVKVTRKLDSHPCVITVEEMAAARHFIKTQGANFSEEQRYNILQPQLEVNPSHAIVQKLGKLRSENPRLASLITEQLFANAMVSAGLVDDPRTVLRSMNQLLEAALEKY